MLNSRGSLLCQYLLQGQSVLSALMALVAVWMSVLPRSLPEQGHPSGCRGMMEARTPLIYTASHCMGVGVGTKTSTPGAISSSPNHKTGREKRSLSLPVLRDCLTLLWCDPKNCNALSITAIETAVSCHHSNHLSADYYRPLKRLGLVGPSIFSRPSAPFSMRKIEWSTEI